MVCLVKSLVQNDMILQKLWQKVSGMTVYRALKIRSSNFLGQQNLQRILHMVMQKYKLETDEIVMYSSSDIIYFIDIKKEPNLLAEE